jgi:hypothetical protein
MKFVFLRFDQEARMSEDPKSYREGFAAGWLAASQAIMEAMRSERQGIPLALAGSLPGSLPRRRGRPPKSMAAPQPVLQQPGKRPRGRPRKKG